MYYYVTIKHDTSIGVRYEENKFFVDEDSAKDYIKFYKETLEDFTTSWIHEYGTCKVQKGRIVPLKSLEYLYSEDDEEVEEEN